MVQRANLDISFQCNTMSPTLWKRVTGSYFEGVFGSPVWMKLESYVNSQYKMDFGKLNDVSRVDFSLSKLGPSSQETLRRAKQAGGNSPQAWIGCPAWGHPEWVGKVYPRGTASGDYLKHYSRQFQAIELNTTHYRIPDRLTVERWKSTVPAGFKFCPKVPQAISHERVLRDSEALSREFCESVLHLGDRLGLSFLQLPPQFSPTELPVLERFFSQLPPEFLRGPGLAVEFRHSGWFRNRELIPGAFAVLDRWGVATVITDVAGRRDVSHASLPAPRTLVRFVGNELHPSDYERIDAWIERIAQWKELGLQELYFFVHQPADLLSPELITYLVPRLNQRCGWKLRLWEPQQEAQLKLL